jgi:hypothetical protein
MSRRRYYPKIDLRRKADFIRTCFEEKGTLSVEDLCQGIRFTGKVWADYKRFVQSISVSSLKVTKPKEQAHVKIENSNISEIKRKVIIDTARLKSQCKHILFTKEKFSKIPFDLDEINASEEWPVLDTTVPYRHDGQRKLLITEIRFLKKRLNDNAILVYAGAAPGTHIAILAEMFPKMLMYLYDPRDFNSKLDEFQNVIIKKDLLTAGAARLFRNTNKDCDIMFISDIRTSTNEQGPTDKDILNDMELQKTLVRELDPVMSLLKFRLPYVNDLDRNKDYDYLGGELWLQPWSPIHSTELRLYVENNNSKEIYSDYRITRVMNFFSDVVRGCNFNGLCYDCASEDEIMKGSRYTGGAVSLRRRIDQLLGDRDSDKVPESSYVDNPFIVPEPRLIPEKIGITPSNEESWDLDSTVSEEDYEIVDTKFSRISDNKPIWINTLRNFREEFYDDYGTSVVVDLAAGQGSDLNTWHRLKIKRLYIMDKDSDAISESVKRYKEGYDSKPMCFELYYAVSRMDEFDIHKTKFQSAQSNEMVYINVEEKIQFNIAFAINLLASRVAARTLMKKLLSYVEGGHILTVICWDYTLQAPEGVEWKSNGLEVITRAVGMETKEIILPERWFSRFKPLIVKDNVLTALRGYVFCSSL